MEYILFAGLALLASASNTIFNRVSGSKINPLITAALKSFLVVVACFIISVCFGHLPTLYSLTKDQWFWIGAVGVVTILDWIFYFIAIKKAHLEAFASFDTACILFFSNLLFMFFMFSSVTKGGAVLNTILYVLGLLFLVGAMIYVVMNKKMNPKAKKAWVFYTVFSALAMSFSLVIVKLKLSSVPSDVITYHQMVIVSIALWIIALISKSYKDLKQANWKLYLKFILLAIFETLLLIFRYQAFSYDNAIPSIINCIISFDFVLVSLGTVFFFKSNNKKELLVVILMITIGMILYVLSGLI